VSLLGSLMPRAGVESVEFDLTFSVSSVADTWNPSDDECSAARELCAAQGPLTDMRSPEEYEAANPDTTVKVGNSVSSLR
jgi:hypothetical protein